MQGNPPPPGKGVVWTVALPDAGLRLDKWLAAEERLGSRRRALEALQRGRVFLEQVEQGASEAGLKLVAGMQIQLWMDRPGSAVRRGAREMHGLNIVYEDDVLIAVDKPSGLLAVPHPQSEDEQSVLTRVARHWRSHAGLEPRVVHRIDRDTSGLVVFARTEAAWADLKQQFFERSPIRHYVALVHGTPRPAQGQWRNILTWDGDRLLQRVSHERDSQGVEALTRYKIREPLVGASLMDFHLVTGRQHQVRVQAMANGHPLVGERIYVGSQELLSGPPHGRQALHAASLTVRHPVTGKPLHIEAELPGDLLHLLTQMRGAARKN